MESLVQQLNNAIVECQNLAEEEGGLIIQKDDSFSFIKVTNSHSGNPIAQGLWEPDRNEFAQKVLAKYKEGWRIYASLHTHPIFLPTPSVLDLTELFRGFPINFIYSKLHKKITEWSVHPIAGEDHDRVNLENVYQTDDTKIIEIIKYKTKITHNE